MSDSSRNTGAVKALAVDALEPWPGLNPRRRFDEDRMRELQESIERKGVLQPILVHDANGDGPWIVAGERRWRAAREAGLETIPSIVREFTETEALEVAIIENAQRSDVTPIEEARGFQRWLEATDGTQAELAEKIGRSQPFIANRIRLLVVPEDLLTLAGEVLEFSWIRDTLVPLAKINDPTNDSWDPAALVFQEIQERLEKLKAEAEADDEIEISEHALRVIVNESVEEVGFACNWNSWMMGGDPGEFEVLGETVKTKLERHPRPCAEGHLERQCQSPLWSICFASEWWKDASAESMKAPPSRGEKKKRRAKLQRSSVTYMKQETLEKKVGYDGYVKILDGSGEMFHRDLFDPERIDTAKLLWMRDRHGAQKLVLVHVGRPQGAITSANQLLETRTAEVLERHVQEERSVVRKRTVSADVLATLFGAACGLGGYGSASTQDRARNIAREHGLLEYDQSVPRGMAFSEFASLSKDDLELIAKVLNLRREREQLDRSGRDHAENLARKELAKEFTRGISEIAPDRPEEAS